MKTKMKRWICQSVTLSVLLDSVSLYAEALPELKKRQGELARQVKDQEAVADGTLLKGDHDKPAVVLFKGFIEVPKTEKL
jgi:hypothetical protein